MGGIDPDRVYTPAELAEAIGRSVHYVYGLCRDGLLTHARSRPGPGRRGPITITGQDWLDYRKRCEVPAADDAQPADGPETPVRTRRPRAKAGKLDPIAEFLRVAATL